MTTPRDRLIDSLQDRAFREAYVAEHLHQGFSFQVKATRKGRSWTQTELGEQAGMRQSRISAIERPDYESLNLKTAKRIASALDAALILRLVPYSKFADFLVGSTSISLGDWTQPIAAFPNDPGLRHGVDEGTVIRGFSSTVVERQEPLPMYDDTPNVIPIRRPDFSNVGSFSGREEKLIVRGP